MGNNMRYFVWICVFLLSVLIVNAQSTRPTIEDIKGIWVNTKDKKSIYIYNDFQKISIYDNLGDTNSYGSVRFEEVYYLKKGLEDKTNINGAEAYTQNIQEASKYFIEVNKNEPRYLEGIYKTWSDLKFRSNYIYDFYPKEELQIDNVRAHVYSYRKRLNRTALNMLYERCLLDNHDYIKEYLEISVRPISVEKSEIYDSDFAKTKMYLIKNDLVTIKGKHSEFLEIEYETANGRIITGLIH
jgi:hypothetical protein